jgi:hypothetical protein
VVTINSSLLTTTLYSSIITTPVYNDTKHSVTFMTLQLSTAMFYNKNKYNLRSAERFRPDRVILRRSMQQCKKKIVFAIQYFVGLYLPLHQQITQHHVMSFINIITSIAERMTKGSRRRRLWSNRWYRVYSLWFLTHHTT